MTVGHGSRKPHKAGKKMVVCLWQDARLQSNDLPAKWMEDDAEDLFPDFLRIGATVSIRFHRNG